MLNIFLKKWVAVILISVMVSGCSTMFGRQSDDQTVNFDSNVSGVEIQCSGLRANTPGSIPLKQSKSHSCVALKEGYEKKIFRIKSGNSWNGFGHSTATNAACWGWWTLGIGIAIGWIVDAVSGAMRNLKEEDIYIEMKPDHSTQTTEKVLNKAVNLGQAIVNIPQDTVKNAASTVLDTTLHGGAESLGVQEKEEIASKKESSEESLKKTRNVTVI